MIKFLNKNMQDDFDSIPLSVKLIYIDNCKFLTQEEKKGSMRKIIDYHKTLSNDKNK